MGIRRNFKRYIYDIFMVWLRQYYGSVFYIQKLIKRKIKHPGDNQKRLFNGENHHILRLFYGGMLTFLWF